MTDEEAKEEEYEPEEVLPRFTNEFLLEILESLALSILNKKSINCRPGEYTLSIEDDLVNEWNMTSGNPVIIRVQSSYILKQLQKKSTLYVLAQGLQYSLEMVHRMRHTLSIVPIADVIWRTEEMRKWKKSASDKALYFDKLVSEKDVTYTEIVVITAAHKTTGLRATITEKIGKANPEHMRTRARKELTKKIKENKAPKEVIYTVAQPSENELVSYRAARAWNGVPSGFIANEMRLDYE